MDNEPDSESSAVGSGGALGALKAAKTKGLSFIAAKNLLISEGFSEEQINQASDQFQYDQAVQVDSPDKVEEYFESHPAQATQDGIDLLKAKSDDDNKEAREMAAADMMAAAVSPRFDRAPTEPQMYFLNKFAFDVGISTWVLLLLIVIINVGSYFLVQSLKLSSWYYCVNGLLTVSLVVYLIKKAKSA
jgi:hypothetical protein